MNERIRKLAIDAGGRGLKISTVGLSLLGEDQIGKFAELIIRECIDCARGAGLADDVAVRNGLGFNDGISEAVTHMKKHFGVEE